jgi:lantibiotic modifying enzyme
VRFGDDLVRLAERRGNESSWNTTQTATTRHLLGYSHGTAGIACALDQLFHATGERVFRQTADAAWRYEASWFDESERNWPDFRVDAHQSAALAGLRENQSDRFVRWWCHGAPGTALALARGVARVPQERRLEPFFTASVETTIASLSRPSLTGGSKEASFCLCHGIAGNAEILMQIAQLARRSDLNLPVLAAAQAGVERHHDSGDWPCGVPGGDQTPGLLLGLAGIGHFYLRLHDTSVPSPLLL